MIASFHPALLLSLLIDAFDWLWTHSPEVAFTIFLCWLTYLLTGLYHRFKVTEAKCASIRDTYIPDLHTKFKGIDNKLGTLLISVNKISTYLATTSKGITPQFFTVQSPLELNDLGRRILRDIGGKKFIDKFSSALIAIMEAKQFKSGLDVQNYSSILLTEKSTDDNFVPIKNYLFQNPVYHLEGDKQISLDLSIAIQIMGIYLRNKYFEKYPDLKKDL